MTQIDRKKRIIGDISVFDKGIEIAPWFNPIAPKSDGFNCKIVDVFPTDKLIQNAKSDPYINDEYISRIEDVDYVGNAVELDELISKDDELGKFDYIISSHNFEHLPNPIKFLQSCCRVLKHNGILSMAIPDKRTCFDYYRPLTTISDWLDAYFTNRCRPTFKNIFDQISLESRYLNNDINQTGFSLNDDPENIILIGNIERAYENWKMMLETNSNSYVDVHCSIFTNSSFLLLINELHFLGLITFIVDDLSETVGNEFFVKLKNVGHCIKDTESEGDFISKRKMLLNMIQSDIAINTMYTHAATVTSFDNLNSAQLSNLLPADFDEFTYVNLHLDLAENNVDGIKHYIQYGKKEGRRYK